jgi:hypothetical protein
MGKLSSRLRPLLAALSLALTGCSAFYQEALVLLRQPGEEMAATPDQVWRDFNCAERERPFVRAKSLEVIPERMQPGARVNYRLVYVMCPSRPSGVIETGISRKILHNGKPVAANFKDKFEIKPGQWNVDAFFTLPPNTPLGVYALEVSFEAPSGKVHKKVRSFVVDDEAYLGG